LAALHSRAVATSDMPVENAAQCTGRVVPHRRMERCRPFGVMDARPTVRWHPGV